MPKALPDLHVLGWPDADTPLDAAADLVGGWRADCGWAFVFDGAVGAVVADVPENEKRLPRMDLAPAERAPSCSESDESTSWTDDAPSVMPVLGVQVLGVPLVKPLAPWS